MVVDLMTEDVAIDPVSILNLPSDVVTASPTAC